MWDNIAVADGGDGNDAEANGIDNRVYALAEIEGSG